MIIKGPLCSLPAFSPKMVKWCSMHQLNLGVCLWSCGSTFRVLLDNYNIWGRDAFENDDNNRLAIAYELFRTWTRERKIAFLGTAHYIACNSEVLNFGKDVVKLQKFGWIKYIIKLDTPLCGILRHSQPRFTSKRLTSWQHPYPELSAKAWNVPCQYIYIYGSSDPYIW